MTSKLVAVAHSTITNHCSCPKEKKRKEKKRKDIGYTTLFVVKQ